MVCPDRVPDAQSRCAGVCLSACIIFLSQRHECPTHTKIAVRRGKRRRKRVVAALGTPISEECSFRQDKLNRPSAKRILGFPISGPKGKATIYAGGDKIRGDLGAFSKLTSRLMGPEKRLTSRN